MRHTEEAIAIARETGWDVDAFAQERGWGGVAIGPVGRHRDSDSLANSNFTVILKDMGRSVGEAVEDVRFRHWACGWVEEIAWDATNPQAQAAAEAWEKRLGDYPVADEDDFSSQEWDDNHPTQNDCYSEQGRDCPCGVIAAKELERKCLNIYEEGDQYAVYDFVRAHHPDIPWAHCPPCEDNVPVSRGDCLVCGSIIPSPPVAG